MSGVYTVNIAENLDYGRHSFKIVKMTEAVNAQSVVLSVLLNGEIKEKPAESEYIIEVIGDSITAGHSSTAIGISDSQRSRFSDGTRTYAYITAENFGAEARVIAQSGQTMTSMYSNYQKERFKDRVGTFKFSSVKKPSVVVIGLGTNDLANKNNATVDYWYEKLSAFVKLIREGYEDNSIPFVFVHDMITNGNLRYYVSRAFEKIRQEQAVLQQENPSEVYGGFYMTNGCYNGGHPRQSGHIYTAKRLAQLLVNEGIIPKSKLKSDATVILEESGKSEELFNSFDGEFSVKSGITYSKAGPLDPDDKENSECFSAFFSADGTQSESTLSLGSIKAEDYSNYKTKGISFYINYKDKTDYSDEENPAKTKAYLTLKSTDQSYKQIIDVEDGVTSRVTLNWEDLSESANYTYQRLIYQQSRPEISLTFLAGEYEFTIDNLKILYNDYSVVTNPNSDYKEISEPLSVIGVTDNFDIPTEEVTTTTTNPALGDNTFVSLYDADSELNPTEYSYSGTKNTPSIFTEEGLPYNTSTSSEKLLGYSGGGTYQNPTLEFTGESISKGVGESIGVRVWVGADTASPAGNRSGILFSFYDSVNEKYYCATQWGASKVGITTEGAWYTVFWADFSKSGNLLSIGAAGGTVKASDVYKNFTRIKLSSGVNGNGSWSTLVNNNIYIDDLQFIYSSDYKPSETATVTTVSTATETTSRAVDIPGKKTLFTMDPDSRPSTAEMTARSGYVTYEEVDGNFAMKITRTTSKGSWQDQSVVFKVPIDEIKALGIPKSIEFDIWTDTGKVYLGQIFMASGAYTSSGGNGATANMGTFTPTNEKKTITIDLTSEQGAIALEKGYAYICLRNSWSADNTCNYAYIDNVVYNYEEITAKVTLDGVEQEISGNRFTLPTSSAKGFIGFFDGETVYQPSDEVFLDKDWNFKTVSVGEVKMLYGAAMRLNEVSGIRYYTSVDTDKIESLREMGFTVGLGTLICPKNYLLEKELTLSVASAVNVKYTADEFYTEETGFKGVVGSIVEIEKYNYNRRFVGRGYVTVKLGDYYKAFYADYSESNILNNTRTVASLAKSISADLAYYNSLNLNNKKIVDSYATAYSGDEEY